MTEINHTESKKHDHSFEREILKKAITLAVGVSLVTSLIIGALLGIAGTTLVQGGIFDWFNGGTNNGEEGGETVRVVTEESAVISAVEKAAPSVVSIVASEDVPVIERYFEEVPFGGFGFLKDFTFTVPRYRQQGTETIRVGAATGFIVSEDGYILTNKHVVSNTKAEYTVITNEGKKYVASIVGIDPLNDIAVLKIEPEERLVPLELGDSNTLQAGQTVIAIGYALGKFDNSVSKGVISGLYRTIEAVSGRGNEQTSEHLEGIIQTDAAINPGNSGGPLLNIEGQVIGMNVAVYQGTENIGFALPINDVRSVYESVRQYGRVVRPQLGVRYALIDEELKKSNNLSYDYGALIVRGKNTGELAVIPGSAADKAGLKEGDIILEANGRRIDHENTLANVLKNSKVGDVITLKVFQDAQEKEISATLTEM